MQDQSSTTSYDPMPKLPYSHHFETNPNGTYWAVGFHLTGRGQLSQEMHGHAEWDRSTAVYAEGAFLKLANGHLTTVAWGRDNGGTSCEPDNSLGAKAISDCPPTPQDSQADFRGYSTDDPGNYAVLIAFFGADHVSPLNVTVAADYPLDDFTQCEGTTRLLSTVPVDGSSDGLDQTLTFTTTGPAFVQVQDYIPGNGYPTFLDVRNGTTPYAHYEVLYSLAGNQRERYTWNETVTGTLTDTLAFGVGAGTWTLTAHMDAVEGVPPGAVVGVIDDPCFVAPDGTLLL
jgi:hypothetical protein